MNNTVAGASSSTGTNAWEQDALAPTPKLRFPEFRGTEGWHVTTLNQLLYEAKTRNRSLELGPADVLSVSGEHGCVNQIEFMGRSYAGATVKDYHVVEHGDVVYTKSPLKKNPFGIIKTNKGKRGIVSTLYAVYRPFPVCSATYIDHFFSGDYNLNVYLQPIVKKGAKNDMKVNNADVLKGNICVPTLAEQQRIADCLSSLDALMAAQACKVDALKTHKKGLMQQLFPRAGETQPRLRFPEFRGSEGWEIKAGNALFDQINDRNPEPGLPVLAITQEHGAIPRHLIDYHVSVSEKSIESYKVVRNGDFIISLRSFQGGIEYSTYSGICSPAYVILRGRGYVTDDYFRHYLKTDRFIQILTKNLEGLRDGKMVSYTQFSELQIPTPSLAEQRRIADCLSSLDALISAEAQTLDTLITHKKGLMQQLFPAPEDATA